MPFFANKFHSFVFHFSPAHTTCSFFTCFHNIRSLSILTPFLHTIHTHHSLTQGREADVVILSCVRASHSAQTAAAPKGATVTADGLKGGSSATNANANATVPASGGVGFLADVRRMNVALTRARCSLWVSDACTHLLCVCVCAHVSLKSVSD